MDEKVKKAFELADYMTVLSNQKALLKEEFYQSLMFYSQGGAFNLTAEFLTFVKLLLDSNQLEDVILIDLNDTPISIPNLNEFYTEILSKYNFAVNSYYTKYHNLIKNRKLEQLIDIL